MKPTQVTHRCRMGAAVLACLLLSACASVAKQGDGGPPPIGWVHGPCIALAEADVAPGTMVMVVMLDGPQRAVQATVGRRAGPGDACPALDDDRREVNIAGGLSFYLIEPEASDGLAIGVLMPEPAPDDALDVDHDGRRDVFEHCATSEGVRFRVRSGASGVGETLWSGYYHLGYDVEADCPGTD